MDATSTTPHIRTSASGVPAHGSGRAFSRTDFLKQQIAGGDGFVRCYEQDSQTALVISFVPIEEVDTTKRVSIRVHSSCAPSEALGAIDCDCKSQLDYAFDLLRRERGLLIYMQQEGRGAGLFTKYVGMSISSHQGVDTYDAYRKMSLAPDLRRYDLVRTILHDLGITQVNVLSNNPSKARELTQLGFDVTSQACFGRATPQNLAYLHSKMSHGDHKLGEMFKNTSGDLYLISASNIPPRFKRLWIFGGDDTLWDDNFMYEEIIRSFVDHVCAHLPLHRDEVRQRLDDVEREVIPDLGFGAPGFLVSLKKTFERLSSQFSKATPEPRELFESVLPRLSALKPEVPVRTMQMLQHIRRNGDGLVLFVQGPLEIQIRKAVQSGLGEFFHAIAITGRKDTVTLRHLLKELPFIAESHVVVGNNLETDIAPAVDLNLTAVHYNNPQSWQLLNRIENRGRGYQEVTDLQAILSMELYAATSPS